MRNKQLSLSNRNRKNFDYACLDLSGSNAIKIQWKRTKAPACKSIYSLPAYLDVSRKNLFTEAIRKLMKSVTVSFGFKFSLIRNDGLRDSVDWLLFTIENE